MANLPSLRRNSQLRQRRSWESPFRDMARMQREMDRMFDDFWSSDWQEDAVPSLVSAYQPACDLQETDSHFIYNFDLPGLRREDVKIELQDNCIHVSGERQQEREENRRGRFETERFYGAFERWIA